DVVVVRFAEDFVAGFQHRKEAEQLMKDGRERFIKFGLKLHAEKTRLIECGRFAAPDRKARGQGKPETCNFLGFTHGCGTDQRGKFTVIGKTMRQRMLKKLKEVNLELRRRMHQAVDEPGRYVQALVGGHVRYFGVPLNRRAIRVFRTVVMEEMAESPESAGYRLVGPHAALHRSLGSACCHLSSLSVGALWRMTRGKSSIWKTCTFGSVRRVSSDRHPYRDNEMMRSILLRSGRGGQTGETKYCADLTSITASRVYSRAYSSSSRRSSLRRIFPVLVLGNSVTNSIFRGYL